MIYYVQGRSVLTYNPSLFWYVVWTAVMPEGQAEALERVRFVYRGRRRLRAKKIKN